MRARNPLWRAPDHRVGASPPHGEEPQTFTSSSTPTHRPRKSLRHQLTALASLTALALFGALALAGPAHADNFVSTSIVESDDPVQAGTPYTYDVTVDVLASGFEEGELTSTTTLTGSAATITGATTNFGPACNVDNNTKTVTCPLGQQDHNGTPEVISIQVTPTAAGTVSAATVVTGPGVGANDSEDTEITEPTEPTPPGCTITGTSGNDTLTGTNGNDVICGLGGNDTINGGNGSDTIYAGSGDDGVAGGNGADTIYGGPGNDTTNGETLLGSLLSFDNGNDTINGGPGNDNLDGQNGNDTLSDTDPSDTDTMSGNVGTDTINVQDNDGNDTANGGLGTDTCTTDPGDTTTSC